MNYHNITHDDMTNGSGLRVVLWLSGCSHNCEECHNPITHNSKSGLAFDKKAKEEVFSSLKKDYISGLTLSGGDPMHLNNREEVLKLVKEVKQFYPDKTIWIYTGYLWENIQKDRTLYDIYIQSDVLVDGKFVKKLYDSSYKWAGSTNQRVIDIRKTQEEGEVVLYEHS
ncbi:MAG: anaerobic ribonucleoside-triphosphate reductase activating protein [Lachnospirales bacterium]